LRRGVFHSTRSLETTIFLFFFFLAFLRDANDALHRVPKADKRRFKKTKVDWIKGRRKRLTNGSPNTKDTRRNAQRILYYPKIDWSAEKYLDLAIAIRRSGISTSQILGRLEISDSWNIHIYQALRPLRFGCSVLLGELLGFWLLYRIGVPWQLLWLLYMVANLAVTLFRVVYAPLTLFITTRVLSDLKAAPSKLSLLIEHECSHAAHKDPLRKIA
jgi:hypothetical protein